MKIGDSVRRKIALISTLFPGGCPILYDDSGGISDLAKIILNEAVEGEIRGIKIENPCYGCRRTAYECSIRRFEYHNEKRRYIAL